MADYRRVDMRISVVLPTYNESENILPVIARTTQALGPSLHEIIIVDDNSPDGTADLARSSGNAKVRVIQRLTERGLASALSRGIHESTGDAIAWLDCDLGIPPEVITELANALKDDVDVVVGSRYVAGGSDSRPWLRGVFSILICVFANAVLWIGVRDATSGFALVKRPVFDRIRFPSQGFGECFTEFLFLAKQKGYRIIEVGYPFGLRKGGQSKLDSHLPAFIKFGFQYAWRILSIRANDLGSRFSKSSARRIKTGAHE